MKKILLTLAVGLSLSLSSFAQTIDKLGNAMVASNQWVRFGGEWRTNWPSVAGFVTSAVTNGLFGSGVNFFGSGGGVLTNYTLTTVATNTAAGTTFWSTNNAAITLAVGTNDANSGSAGITNNQQNLSLGILTNSQSHIIAANNPYLLLQSTNGATDARQWIIVNQSASNLVVGFANDALTSTSFVFRVEPRTITALGTTKRINFGEETSRIDGRWFGRVSILRTNATPDVGLEVGNALFVRSVFTNAGSDWHVNQGSAVDVYGFTKEAFVGLAGAFGVHMVSTNVLQAHQSNDLFGTFIEIVVDDAGRAQGLEIDSYGAYGTNRQNNVHNIGNFLIMKYLTNNPTFGSDGLVISTFPGAGGGIGALARNGQTNQTVDSLLALVGHAGPPGVTNAAGIFAAKIGGRAGIWSSNDPPGGRVSSRFGGGWLIQDFDTWGILFTNVWAASNTTVKIIGFPDGTYQNTAPTGVNAFGSGGGIITNWIYTVAVSSNGTPTVTTNGSTITTTISGIPPGGEGGGSSTNITPIQNPVVLSSAQGELTYPFTGTSGSNIISRCNWNIGGTNLVGYYSFNTVSLQDNTSQIDLCPPPTATNWSSASSTALTWYAAMSTASALSNIEYATVVIGGNRFSTNYNTGTANQPVQIVVLTNQAPAFAVGTPISVVFTNRVFASGTNAHGQFRGNFSP